MSDSPTPDASAVPAIKKMRVIVVDDSPVILEMFKLLVMPDEDPLFEIVATAPNGNAGLEAVIAHQPDLVVLDYEMPGLDGVSLIRKIKATRAETHVFLMSSHVDEDRNLEKSALEAGAVDFIPKPQKDYNVGMVRQLIELDLRGKGVTFDE